MFKKRASREELGQENSILDILILIQFMGSFLCVQKGRYLHLQQNNKNYENN